MKKEIKNEPVEFQLSDHPIRAFERVNGYPDGLDRKRIVRRKMEFFLALDPNADIDRSIFMRCYPAGVLLLNGHGGAELERFSPAFAQPDAEDLLTAIREARPEIAKMETERAQTAAEAAIMKAAAEENENPASVELFFTQIESRERSVKLLDMKLATMRRKLEKDQKRVLDLLAEERARQSAAELDAIRTEAHAINAAINEAYARANRLRPRLQRLSESTTAEFHPDINWVGALDTNELKVLMTFRMAPALELTATSLRFAIQPIKQVSQTGDRK